MDDGDTPISLIEHLHLERAMASLNSGLRLNAAANAVTYGSDRHSVEFWDALPGRSDL